MRVNKCNKVNDMIRRAVGYKASASVTLEQYKTLIYKIFYKSHIDSIERIQRNVTRYIMHYSWL